MYYLKIVFSANTSLDFESFVSFLPLYQRSFNLVFEKNHLASSSRLSLNDSVIKKVSHLEKVFEGYLQS